MGHDPDDPTLGRKVLDGGRNRVEGLRIERPETFVEEDRFEACRALCRKLSQLLGEGESQRQ